MSPENPMNSGEGLFEPDLLVTAQEQESLAFWEDWCDENYKIIDQLGDGVFGQQWRSSQARRRASIDRLTDLFSLAQANNCFPRVLARVEKKLRPLEQEKRERKEKDGRRRALVLVPCRTQIIMTLKNLCGWKQKHLADDYSLSMSTISARCLDVRKIFLSLPQDKTFINSLTGEHGKEYLRLVRASTESTPSQREWSKRQKVEILKISGDSGDEDSSDKRYFRFTLLDMYGEMTVKGEPARVDIPVSADLIPVLEKLCLKGQVSEKEAEGISRLQMALGRSGLIGLLSHKIEVVNGSRTASYFLKELDKSTRSNFITSFFETCR